MPNSKQPHSVPLGGGQLRSANPADWQEQPTPGSAWQPLLQGFWQSEPGRNLRSSLQQRLNNGETIYPAQPLRALKFLEPKDVRVLILGQDPYHTPGCAEGLAFSVASGIQIPPSLRNIHKELHTDLGWPMPSHGSLLPWTENGVLLLNTVLTVAKGVAKSHRDIGWQCLTDGIIRSVASNSRACVHLLWGNDAQQKAELIKEQCNSTNPNPNKYKILPCSHPSPLSALRGSTPFIGSRHFSQTQQWFHTQNIDWQWPKLGSLE